MNLLSKLSHQTRRSLRRAGISSIGQLAGLTPTQILALPGCGSSALTEIKQALATVSIKLNGDSALPQKPERPAPPIYDDDGLLATPTREVFEDETRVKNALLVGKINTIGQLVRMKEEDLLGLYNLGKTSVAIIKDTLTGLKLRLGMSDEELKAVALHRRSEAEESLLRAFSLPPEAGPLVVDEIPGLSNRTINCLKAANIRTVAQVMSNTDHDLMMLRGFGTTCLAELKKGLQKVPALIREWKAKGLLATAITPEDRPVVPLEMPIEQVFPQRGLRRTLLAAKIRTLEELIRKPTHELLQLPDFDRNSLELVRRHLKPWMVGVGMSEGDVDEIRRCNDLRVVAANSQKPSLPIGPGSFNAVLKLPIEQAFDEETRVKNSLTVAGIATVEDVVRRRPEELLALPHFGRHCLESIERRLRTWCLHLGMSAHELEEAKARNSDAAPEQPAARLIDIVREFKASLPQRERQILNVHYDPINRSTLEKTGRKFRLTRERVRQLASRACKRTFVKLLRAGLPLVASHIRDAGGFYDPSDAAIDFLQATEKELRPLAPLLNGIADAAKNSDAIYLDEDFFIWRLGREPIIERLRPLRETLTGLATANDVASAIRTVLRLPEDAAPIARAIADRYCAKELVQIPGHDFWWRQRANKQDVVEGLLLHLFPSGAHFSDIAAVTQQMPGKWRLIARNVHAQLTNNRNVVLWGRGSFRHKTLVKLNEPLLEQLLEKIDDFFLPGVRTISAHAVFEKNRSLAVQVGLPNPYALYGCLEWLHPKRYLYRHFPDIESLSAKRIPRQRRVHELEAILADSDGPLSVEEIIQRMGGHRRLKDYQVAQRLPESDCVLLYDSGCFVHESVLGISEEQKNEIRRQARTLLLQPPGFATTKTIRLNVDLPALKLPWTLKLLGSILEKDPELTRYYNIVALGYFPSWEALLEKIIGTVIGDRPGIRLDELNDHLTSNGYLAVPLSSSAFSKFTKVTIDDGYVRAAA